jgi:hypothetical protein
MCQPDLSEEGGEFVVKHYEKSKSKYGKEIQETG